MNNIDIDPFRTMVILNTDGSTTDILCNDFIEVKGRFIVVNTQVMKKVLQKSNSSRIAIVNPDKCKPHKCKRECERFCPINNQGKRCVTHDSSLAQLKGSKAEISEILCSGCNICTKKCPFDAIKIINLPQALGEVTHRYSNNGFQLYGLPMPERNTVLALVGGNGCGKTTALQIIIGRIIPNLGIVDGNITTRKKLNLLYRGTNIQNYLKDLDKGLNINYKPQNIQTLRQNTNTISSLVNNALLVSLDIQNLADRTCESLSEGELQRVYIGITLSSDADMIVFDEPCTYLDIYQRIAVSKLIRDSKIPYKIVIEHDFTALDYIADKVCLFYGENGAYGNVTLPLTTSEGLNAFLNGYIPYSNTRFRSDALNFNFSKEDKPIIKHHSITYENFTVSYPNFILNVGKGRISSSSVTVLLGHNGSGKTTFINSLPSHVSPNMIVSHKPQNVYIDSDVKVYDYLLSIISGMLIDYNFINDVIDPLSISHVFNQKISTLSGGELQKISLIACLGSIADIYLIDEPSCYLDVESVLTVAKVLKRFASNNSKYMFVVEHDFTLGLYLADNVLLFNSGNVSKPYPTKTGYNKFLLDLGITMRRDHDTHRPRVNKPNSQNDIIHRSHILSHHTKKNSFTVTETPDLSW